MDEVVKFTRSQEDQQAAQMLGQDASQTKASDAILDVLADFLHKSNVRE